MTAGAGRPGAGPALAIGPLRLDPAYRVVSRELERLIVGGVLKPGDALPSETDLAGRFGVHRSTVREGIRRLESEGLVRRETRKRLVVSVPDEEDLAPRASRAMLLQQVTFRELWEAALVLEPLAAALTAARRADAVLAALDDNLARTAAAVAAGDSPIELDMEFHSLIAAGSRNRALILAREPIGQLLYPAYRAVRPHVPQSAGRLLEAHRRIVEAIRAGDADEARAWMVRHVEDLNRAWIIAGLSPDTPMAAL